jgi:phosphatidylglycerol lysyltransferase
LRSYRLGNLRPERILALFTGIMAMINLISAVTPALSDRLRLLEQVAPMQIRTGTRLATAFACFALLLLASGIWRRKRTAWMITLVTLLITSFAHVIKGFDFEEAILALFLIIGLIVFRDRFQARSDTPTIIQGLRTLGTALLFTILYGMLGFFILDNHFTVQFNLLDAFYQTIRMFTEFSNPGLIATTRFGR